MSLSGTKRPNDDSPSTMRNMIEEETMDLKQICRALLSLQDLMDQILARLDLYDKWMSYDGAPSWFVHKHMVSPEHKTLIKMDSTIPSLTYAAYIIKEAAKAPEKSLNAVIEKLPDSPTRKDGKEIIESDGAFIRKICDNAGVPHPLEFWRQPQKSNDRPRIIKVKFPTTKDRDNFIYRFRKNLPHGTNGRPPTCRRDMTVPELELLYTLRKQVYEMNKEAGCLKYYVKDLTVAISPSPRPFTTTGSK